MAAYFFLKDTKINKNEQNSLIFRCRIGGKMVVKGLGLKVITKDWDQKEQRVRRSFEGYKKINDKLEIIQEELNSFNGDLTKDDVERVVHAVKANKPMNSKYNLLEVLKYRIKALEEDATIAENTIITYKNSKMVVEQFCKENRFDITENLFNQFQNFINYCRKEGYKDNSIKLYLNKIKASINFFNKRNDRLVKIPSLQEFNWFKEEKEKIFLTKKEVKILYDFALATEENLVIDIGRDEEQLKYLKYFLFRCFTGMRVSEMTKRNIDKEKLNPFSNQTYSFSYFSYKTDKVVNVPTLGNHFAFNIAESLNYDFPLEYLGTPYLRKEKDAVNYYFSIIIKSKREVEVVDNQGIKKLKVAGNITSHCARRTFARMIYDHKKNIYFVSKLLGHSDIKTSEIYLGLNLKEEFEEYSDFTL